GRDSMEKRSLIISVDEEYSRMKLDDIAKAPPIFQEDGRITAGNASSLNDGAAALVLLSASRARDMGISPMARVVSFADAALEARHVAKAPSAAVRKAMQAARMSTVNFYEIHETFAAVSWSIAYAVQWPAETGPCQGPGSLNVSGGIGQHAAVGSGPFACQRQRWSGGPGPSLGGLRGADRQHAADCADAAGCRDGLRGHLQHRRRGDGHGH
ncbi:unnamed protein product, partial [Cladocopium goreaui]